MQGGEYAAIIINDKNVSGFLHGSTVSFYICEDKYILFSRERGKKNNKLGIPEHIMPWYAMYHGKVRVTLVWYKLYHGEYTVYPRRIHVVPRQVRTVSLQQL